MKMPKQKPGLSKQDYGTPRDFLNALERRFGFIEVDLAAHQENYKAADYLGPGSPHAEDSLSFDWLSFGTSANSFLNPEFAKIAPWAKKCAETLPGLDGGLIHFLVPAAVGSNWFAKYVHKKALVLVLNGRLTFEGMGPNPQTGKIEPYPKDCMLCVYGMTPGFDVWRWKATMGARETLEELSAESPSATGSNRDREEGDQGMTTADTGLGIHKAICALKLAIAGGGGIQKGRTAPMGYAFRGIEDFDNILCGLTAEHGVAMYPRIISKELRDGSTAKGAYQAHALVEVEWSLVCASDGSKQICSTMGEAMDTQDKAFNKAMQASRKYAILMALMIPTAGDDTEIYVPEPATAQRAPTPAPAPVEHRATYVPEPAAAPPPEAKRTRGPNKPKHDPAIVVHQAEITRPADVLNGSITNGSNGAGHAPPFAEEAPAKADSYISPAKATDAVSRINGTQTFPILYAFAQDADTAYPAGHPDREFVYSAIRNRAIGLFGSATNMAFVQEGIELVSALGAPAELKQAANAAYGRFRK